MEAEREGKGVAGLIAVAFMLDRREGFELELERQQCDSLSVPSVDEEEWRIERRTDWKVSMREEEMMARLA